MKQAILARPTHHEVHDRPPPTMGPADVMVRVSVCGVCASELPPWRGDGGAYPRELGHEVTGVVVEVGKEVHSVQPGQLVTGLFGRGFAEYAVTSADRVIPVPEGMPAEVALGEPLSCVISGARRTRVTPGDLVVIIGLGFMGLLTLQAIRLLGPARIVAVDVRAEALETARRLGADEAYTPDQVPDHLYLTSWDRLDGNFGADVVVEASGTQAGLTLAGRLVKAHGFLSIVGYHQGAPRTVEMEMWNWKAFDLLNAHERRVDVQMDSMRRGLDLVASGKIEIASLLSHRFPLDEIDRGFQALHEKPPGFLKSLIVM